MVMPFEVYTDHYALQWLKTMRTGSALLHRWSAALEEYDFTVRHRPGKAQTHVDGLSQLPVGLAPPQDTLLHVQIDTEEEARKLAQELHSTTHLGSQALWKLFSDRYAYKAGRRLYIEVAKSCPQCQLGSNHGHRLKTTGTIQSRGPWDMLSVDIVGLLSTDHRHEFLTMFVDCYSQYTILVPASNHTASTVSDALLRHVIPYFGTPRRLLSDCSREFVGDVWGKLMRSLGVQRVLTSPYHHKGNAVNERSHWTMKNMLRARLLEGTSSRAWVEKVPGLMLTLNAMVHEPHGFLASMVTTGQEPTLPPDLQNDACTSPSLDNPTDYVEVLRQRLSLTHQQMTALPPPASANPHQEGSLIFVMTTPPERANKLTPRSIWVHDPTSPTPHRQDDLTSPALASTKNTPPLEIHHKLPRHLRPRRRRRKQPVSSANENSASCVADPVIPLGPSANKNSPRLPPSAVTRLRSTANRNSPFPGPQPGTSWSSRSAFLKHPQSIQSSPMSQRPVPAANQNRDRPFFLDHPEVRGVYKPARIDPRQDSTANCQRDNFSGFGLSSPALQQPPTKSFSGSPSRQHLTDPTREAREAGRQRPGIAYHLPRAACPDTRLSIDAAPPEAAVLRRGERPPTVVDIPELGRIGGTRLLGPS